MHTVNTRSVGFIIDYYFVFTDSSKFEEEGAKPLKVYGLDKRLYSNIFIVILK